MRSYILIICLVMPLFCIGQSKEDIKKELEKQIEMKNHYSTEADKLRAENKELVAKVEKLEATIQEATDTSGNVRVVKGQEFIYCEIVGVQKFLSTKVIVGLDYGQERKMFQSNAVKDESGKVKTFNSMIDALNYMGKDGWEFVQAYTVTHSNQNVYHYLLKKPAS